MMHIGIKLSIQLPLLSGAALWIVAAVATRGRLRRLGFRILNAKGQRAQLASEPADARPDARPDARRDDATATG